MEAKFTPGPWFPVTNTAGGWDVNVGPRQYDQSVANVGLCTYIEEGCESGNAHLIAAAPELYEGVVNSILRLLHIAERLEHKMTGTEKAQLADYASNTAAELACITAKARGESS